MSSVAEDPERCVPFHRTTILPVLRYTLNRRISHSVFATQIHPLEDPLINMPLDTAGISGKSAASAKPPKRTDRLSSLAEYACAGDDSHYRVRLQSLFAQIEKEFETLYLENLNCTCDGPAV